MTMLRRSRVARAVAGAAVLLAAVMTGCVNGPTSSGGTRCPEYVEWTSAGEIDPALRVLRPDGGETFVAGRPCTLSVSAGEPADIIVQLEIDGVVFTPEQLRGTHKIHRDTTLAFTLPAHFTNTFFDTVTGMPRDTLLATESLSCRVRITQYESPEFFDVSNCYFAIVN